MSDGQDTISGVNLDDTRNLAGMYPQCVIAVGNSNEDRGVAADTAAKNSHWRFVFQNMPSTENKDSTSTPPEQQSSSNIIYQEDHDPRGIQRQRPREGFFINNQQMIHEFSDADLLLALLRYRHAAQEYGARLFVRYQPKDDSEEPQRKLDDVTAIMRSAEWTITGPQTSSDSAKATVIIGAQAANNSIGQTGGPSFGSPGGAS